MCNPTSFCSTTCHPEETSQPHAASRWGPRQVCHKKDCLKVTGFFMFIIGLGLVSTTPLVESKEHVYVAQFISGLTLMFGGCCFLAGAEALRRRPF